MKILGVTKLTDLPWLNLFQVEFEGKDGKVGKWNFCSRKKEVRPGQYPTEADAVHIIPLLKDGRKRKLVAIKEFRIPLGAPEYGFPAGLVNPNEDLLVAAKRELKEETGLKVTKVLYVSPTCVTSAGMSDESNKFVVVECTGTVDLSGLEDSEDIVVDVLDIDQLSELLAKNNNISGKALPFMLVFQALKKIAWPRHMQQDHKKKKQKPEPPTPPQINVTDTPAPKVPPSDVAAALGAEPVGLLDKVGFPLSVEQLSSLKPNGE